ncbi:hypothetical protein Q3G72_030998 [Acer saccharum]|nr:hypothetical protein Q3G72_030998 [Acer saccharum]
MFFTLWKDLPKVDYPSDVNYLLSIPNFPNCPVLPWYQVPQLYRMFKEGDPDWEFQRNGSLDNIASWGIVLNTSTCLEQVYIDYIKKQVGHDRVWAVGPILPTHSVGHIDHGRPSSVPCHELIEWLDAQQFLNAQLLVEQLRVGIRVGEGIQNIPESAVLASLLAEAVNGSRPEKLRAKELHDAVLAAVVKGGSSDKHLNEFVDSLYELK